MGYLGNQPTATPIQSSDLADGIVTNAKLGTDISAAKLTAGTLADARFPATLPAISGANLTNISAGKVLQAVNQVYSTETTRTSTSLGNTGIDLSITPSATSSKVLVLVNCGQIEIGNSSTQGIDLQLDRSIGASDTTLISQLQNNAGAFTNLNHAVYRTFTGHASTAYLDSPNTTSACRYRVYFKCYNTDTFVGVQMHSTTSTIACLEIGA